MIASVTRNVILRPTRSPMRPNTRAPERTHDEADREGRERQDEGGRLSTPEKKWDANVPGERAVQEEVVPLEERAERRRADDVRARRRAAGPRLPPLQAVQALRRKTGSLRTIR